MTDRLERDNDFCTSCHLTADVPLHADIRADFDAAAAASLAGRHGATAIQRAADDPESAFRCIDCHGGVGFVGRARVKALAAKDAFWYVLGHFEEPTGMAWPLWDEDCRKCHGSFEESDVAEWQSPRFHQLPVHNAALGVDCVECHRAHETNVDPASFFLDVPWVRSQCARCHPEFEEGMG